MRLIDADLLAGKYRRAAEQEGNIFFPARYIADDIDAQPTAHPEIDKGCNEKIYCNVSADS